MKRYTGPGCDRELALRVYASRLIGADGSLVLHGGGNSSLKTRLPDDTGQEVEALLVKASGWDLALIEPAGFCALRLQALKDLMPMAGLNDQELANVLRTRMLDSRAPDPSVEALLHAFLPHRYVDHSHADAILSLLDQAEPEALCQQLFGGSLGVVGFFMSGFDLARKAAEVYRANPEVQGLLLVRHGLVTFGETASESYQRQIQFVSAAESYCQQRRRPATAARPAGHGFTYQRVAPRLRGQLNASGKRFVLVSRQSEAIADFVARPDLEAVSQRGPVTPDHTVRTKRLPMVLDLSGLDSEQQLQERIREAVAAFRDQYRKYVERNLSAVGSQAAPIDLEPRVILVPGLGLMAAGPSLKDAVIAADIYQHSIQVIADAEAVGRYQPVSEADAFRYEFWSLEQAKLGASPRGALAGAVVYVTGAASGIGEATARLFAREGACLYLVDRDRERLQALAEELGSGWQQLDVTDESAVKASVERATELFGGLDGAVSNAGYAPQSPIDTCPSSLLRESFEVNFFAHQHVSAAVTQVLRAQGNGGFLLHNVSKAAFNPGGGFGPYALPKAAQMALMKQYAVEGAEYGIRSNAINADRVRTGLFSEKLIEERAQARGLKADDYFKSNLLRREVTAYDVAQAFLALAQAESTTGCVITVDGGNMAACPR